MKTTYLNDLIDYQKNNATAYLPVGTLEWHGSHLPIETDFLVAQRLCELVAEKVPGYILPPFYLGTDREHNVGDRILNGMDARLGKKLPGSFYYLKPETLAEVIKGLVTNLLERGFKKVIIITGHAGSKHVEVLEEVARELEGLIFINPFVFMNQAFHHADEWELSIFWSCYPEEEVRSLSMKLLEGDEFVSHRGYDARSKTNKAHAEIYVSDMVAGIVDKLKG